MLMGWHAKDTAKAGRVKQRIFAERCAKTQTPRSIWQQSIPSLLNIGYANYQESLVNIMMMQGDSASRESFMKNSFSSSDFAHKAFVANRIVHLRKQKE